MNRIAAARGLTPPWTATGVEIPAWLANADVTGWGVVELGEMRARLLRKADRDRHGVVYTPKEITGFVTQSAFEVALKEFGDASPEAVLRLVALDPFCGPGIFLVWSARWIANEYVTRLAAETGLSDEARQTAVRMVLPGVMRRCVYGVDLDATAVDLAKSVLWLEIDGAEPITFMDRNVIVGDTFKDQLPPALNELYDAVRLSGLSSCDGH